MAKLIPGENDLASQCPDVAAEWHPFKNGNLLPSQIAVKSSKRAWWLGACGHEWEAIVFNRAGNGTGCPYCSGRKVLSGFNDLESLRPDLAAEWAYDLNEVLPSELSLGSHVHAWWRCEYGHTWEAEVKNRVNGRGCPYCTGQKPVVGFNDLASCHPELLSQWAYDLNDISPDEVSCGSCRKVWWRCEHDHTWETTIWNRTKAGHGCPYCAGLKVDPGFNDLESQFPDVASEWAYDLNDRAPADVYHSSCRDVWWRCKHGHVWQASIQARTRHHTGCPHCAMSSGEQAVAHVLDDLGIDYLYDKPLGDCRNIAPLRHDFILLDNDGRVMSTIEFNGKQHYEPVAFGECSLEEVADSYRDIVRRDFVKARWLTSRGIPQLTIPFGDIDRIREIIERFVSGADAAHSIVVYSVPIYI